MENYPIKSVTFGGFDKQDVIRYIEQTVLENDAARKELQDEIDRLHIRIDELTAANSALQNDVEILSAEKASMENSLRGENFASSAKIKELEDEIAKLRPDAANYAQFRDRWVPSSVKPASVPMLLSAHPTSS
jgi:predicted RNase H-like nuclease (RuvC/YqgF family)